MMEVEHHFLAYVMIIIFAGKNHQWMPNFVGKSVTRNRIFDIIKVSPHKILYSYKEKTNFTVEKSGEYHLTKVFS